LPEENEDSFIAPPDPAGESIRIAVADGATESSFSREWADLLVCYYDAFLNFDTHFAGIFPAIRKSWMERIRYDSLEWYAQQKLEMGAFASLLGADINLVTGRVNITAVGDSNFFAFRKGSMLKAFPLDNSEAFGNTPLLISSEHHKNRISSDFFKKDFFDLLPGDMLIAGTDAICQWILKETETGNHPIDELYRLPDTKNNQSSFQNWLDELRKLRRIKNDDTTIVLIQIA
jgi:hypothetical protein